MAGTSRSIEGVDHSRAPKKSPEEVEGLRRANQAAGEVLTLIGNLLRPGVTIRELDSAARAEIGELGMQVDRHGLQYDKAHAAYFYDFSDEMAIAWGVNDSVSYLSVSDRVLEAGDLLTTDCSVIKDGWSGDTARNWLVGHEGSIEARALQYVAFVTTAIGVSMCRPGVEWNTIARAMDEFAAGRGMPIVRWGPKSAADLGAGCSHSIGHIHNDGWNLYNYPDAHNDGRTLEEGMTITIEPFLTSGDGVGILDDDGVQRTVDGSLVTFWEHVVAITADGCELLDQRPGDSPFDHELLPRLIDP